MTFSQIGSSQSNDEIPAAGKQGILKLSKAQQNTWNRSMADNFSGYFLCYDTYFSSR
ncbi:hypothetical protein [Liquorilactobacillus uvarum]|uniref:hypothetical protein n=1 Tax=Liquorilactobacillus uvarum TaxID=303240 RepID=UPI00288A7674|nr:hypothetical protein [Liquorilactobacillus uvarum]